jgi:predicted RNase H-like HicB family nuclease
MKQYLPYVSVAIGLTGISLALYFHHQAVKERQPLYYVGKRAVIVDASVSTPSPITVLYKGKPVGETDSVIAATVYFWNGGKLPIRAEDVLEPLSIQLGSPSDILESRLIRISRPVIRFVKQDTAESEKHLVPISFAILEHNDGAAIQVIYVGRIDVPIAVKGTIVESGSPKLFSIDTSDKTNEMSHTNSVTYHIEIDREDDGRFIADIPELPGVTVYGGTEEEARAKVEALALRVIADEIEQSKRAVPAVMFA